MTRPKIVFFGSGPVAAKSLQLLQTHCSIEAVITKPTTIKEMSEIAKGISTYSVKNRSELDDLIDSNTFQSKLGVLIDFGIIVSQKVINSFERGIINSHFSLLPEWRGADPITFAILSGQEKTGVSLMLLVEAMDEGPVISCGVYRLNGTETSSILTNELILLSDALLKSELPRYLKDNVQGTQQNRLSDLIPGHPKKASYSRKLTKKDGILDFSKPAKILEREIRAFIEWPKSRTTLDNIDVIITEASAVDIKGDQGDFEFKDNQIYIYCSEGAIAIKKIKPAGKNEMTIEAFLVGMKNRKKPKH